MAAFFKLPDDLQLDELTNATLMKLEQFRDRTSTGEMFYEHKRAHYRPKLPGLILTLSQTWCEL